MTIFNKDLKDIIVIKQMNNEQVWTDTEIGTCLLIMAIAIVLGTLLGTFIALP